jgi:DNA-3-methyladenine glycosylase I
MKRCFGGDGDLMGSYHDLEWGRPVTTDRGIFERICLEAFQAGISWLIVLRKREALRSLFAGFDPEKVARFGSREVKRLLVDASGIRNRAKIEAAVANARATVALADEGASLIEVVWSHAPRRSRAPRTWKEVPASTPESAHLAKDLRKRGFRFVGPTTAYSTMQAAGVVNDHLARCSVRTEVRAEQRAARAELLSELNRQAALT